MGIKTVLQRESSALPVRWSCRGRESEREDGKKNVETGHSFVKIINK